MYGLLGLGPSGLGLPSPTTLSDMPVSRSNNVSTTCSTARRPLRFARSSLQMHTHGRTSANPTVIGITSDHGHRVISTVTKIIVATTTATARTTEGDRTMVVTNTTMTIIEQTMIMNDMTRTGMTGMSSGIHETIGGILIEVRETMDGITTIVVATLLNPNRVALFTTTSHGPIRLHRIPQIAHTLPHRMTAPIPATRHRFPV